MEDTPSADPQIQKDYEAALGAFLVAFNRVENTVREVIRNALMVSKPEDIIQHIRLDFFRQNLEILTALSKRFPDPISKNLTEDIKNLSKERNRLAHGHFDQNPFSGDYKVVGRDGGKPIPIPEIQNLTEQANVICDKLRYAEFWFLFDDPGEGRNS